MRLHAFLLVEYYWFKVLYTAAVFFDTALVLVYCGARRAARPLFCVVLTRPPGGGDAAAAPTRSIASLTLGSWSNKCVPPPPLPSRPP